jgi:hypothetical protein
MSAISGKFSHDISQLDSISDEKLETPMSDRQTPIHYTDTDPSQKSIAQSIHLSDDDLPNESPVVQKLISNITNSNSEVQQSMISEVASNIGEVVEQIGFVIALGVDEAIGIRIPTC